MVKRLLLTVTMLAGMSTSSDTNYINDQGKELMTYWDNAAFENLKDLLLQVMEYDTEAIASWGVDGMNAMRTPITTPVCGITEGYILQGKIAAYTGRFEVVDGRWERVGDADDMEFFFTDKNGNDCLMKITTSGETKVVNIPYDIDEDDSNLGKKETRDAMKELLSGVKVVALEIPGHAECTLTQGGLQVMSLQADIDLSYFTDGWNVTKGYAFDMLFSVAKSASARMRGNTIPGNYDIALNVKQNPGEGIGFSAAARVGDKTIASFSLNAEGELNFDETFISREENSIQFHDMGIKSILAELDILGTIQAKLAIPDFAAFMQQFSGLSSLNMTSEDDAKKVADVFNEQMSINFYYDHSEDPNGWIGFMPASEKDGRRWTVEPTISFTSDNSTQSAKDFFTEENLPDLFGTVTSIYGDINEMVTVVTKKVEEMGKEATRIMAVTKEKGFYNDGENVQLLGQKPGSSAEIYTTGGAFCARVKVDADGKAELPNSLKPNSVYIIKTASGTKKFYKR
jgi:hypothetical protein